MAKRKTSKPAKKIWARGRYRKVRGQPRYYDLVAHRTISRYQYQKRRQDAPRRKSNLAIPARVKRVIQRTAAANAKRADTLAKAYQSKVAYETGKRPTLAQVRKDPKFRELLAELSRDTKGRSKTSRRAKVLVELGLRDSSWTHNVGDSMPGELSDARAAAVLMGHGV